MLSPPSMGEADKKKLVTQDTLDSPSLSQTPSVSSEDPLSPVVRCKYCVNLCSDWDLSVCIAVRLAVTTRVCTSLTLHVFSFLSFTALSCRVWTGNCQLTSIGRCQGDGWEAATGPASGACLFRVLQREDSGITSSYAAPSQTSKGLQPSGRCSSFIFNKLTWQKYQFLVYELNKNMMSRNTEMSYPSCPPPFLASSGQHPISAQPELHPAPALQGSHFQRRITQRNLSPHPGTSGSAAAPDLADGGRQRCHRGLGWQIWAAVTRRGVCIRHPGLEDHPAAFQPWGHLLRQVTVKIYI